MTVVATLITLSGCHFRSSYDYNYNSYNSIGRSSILLLFPSFDTWYSSNLVLAGQELMSMGLITMTGAFKPQETLLIYENCRANFQYLLSLVWGKIVSTLELGIWTNWTYWICAYVKKYADICVYLAPHIRFFPTTNKSGWPSHINSHVLCKLSLVFVPPDKATGSTLCVARGQLCRGSSVGIQATEEMATTIGRPVHVTCEWWS